MDYNKVKTFLIVAEHGSITMAAQLLRRSQSAVSQQILLLEEELEFKLLERKNAKIFLSPDGRALFDLAKKNLQTIDDAVLDIKKNKKLVEGHILVGELSDYGNQFQLGDFLGPFCSKYPQVSFSMVKGSSPSLEQGLIDHSVDLAFTVYFSLPEMFHRHQIETTWHSLYSSPSYLDSVSGIQTYAKLVDCSLIDLDSKFMCIGTLVKKNAPALVSRLKNRKPNIVVNSHLASKKIVSSGFGVAVLPDYLVENELKSGVIVPVLKSGKKVYAGLDLAYRTNRTLRLCEQLFIDFCVRKSAKIFSKV